MMSELRSNCSHGPQMEKVEGGLTFCGACGIHWVPKNSPKPPIGLTVMEALARYDEWMGSDGDNESFNLFQQSMEDLRETVGRLIDRSYL